MEPIVHVCNGDSTADILSLAELPGEIRVWADALDQGPVLPLSDEEHWKRRGEFWATRGIPDDGRLAAWDRGVDEAARADELILWFEHDLFDQLALIRLLSRLARRGLPATLTIVSIDRHTEVPTFLGFITWTYALSRVAPTRVTVTVVLNPIAAAIAGAWYLGEPLDPRIIAGLALVTISIVVVNWASRARDGGEAPRAGR